MLTATFPARIGRYETKGILAAGGMGDLYLARDTNPNTNRLVALKLLNANLNTGDLRERFGRESRALAALSHPNIVNIYDSGEFEGSPFIVMEYVRGETLAEKIKRREPLSLSEKLKLMMEVCAGLGHAHEVGVIHRDIKPANLIVDLQGRLRILDFGIARVTEGALTRAGFEMTQFNVRVGTPGYMSPEQIEGREVDNRSDLFAAGAVLYELLSYREAFAGGNTRQIEDKVLQADPPPLGSVVPGLDREIVRIVNRALEKDRARRFQDAAEFERALEAQRWRLGPVENTSPPLRATPPPSPVSGRSSRDARADVAYQRSVAVYRDGAREAARRFAIEAVAENPNHLGARAFLEHLDPSPWTAAFPASVPAVTPIPSTSAESSPGPSRLSGPSGPSRLSGPARPSGPSRAPAAMPPSPASAAGRSKSGGSGPHEKASWRRYLAMSTAMWKRYQVPAMIVGILVAVVVLAILVIAVIGWPPSTRVLTVTKPTGGSILGRYISCGTIGSTCTANSTSPDIIQLTAQPDDGFAFVSWAGDCAPNGRVMMNAARTCSATFERMLAPPPPITHVLTILPPQGGTIVGFGINCGTQGSQCSTSVPNGDEVKLDVYADKGFEFKGYTGACAPTGSIIMSEPRECGALFAQHVGIQASPSSTSSRPEPGHPVPPPPSFARDNPPNPGARDQPDSKSSTREGTPSGTPSIAPPGTPSGVPSGAPPGTPPDTPSSQSVAEKNAKTNIPKTLEAYRKAHERLNLKEVQLVYPAAPLVLKEQFRQLKSMVYELQKEQEFTDLDLPAGTATVKVGYKMTFRVPAGNAPPPEEGYVIFKLHRTGLNSDTWLIDLAEYHPKVPG